MYYECDLKFYLIDNLRKTLVTSMNNSTLDNSGHMFETKGI